MQLLPIVGSVLSLTSCLGLQFSCSLGNNVRLVKQPADNNNLRIRSLAVVSLNYHRGHRQMVAGRSRRSSRIGGGCNSLRDHRGARSRAWLPFAHFTLSIPLRSVPLLLRPAAQLDFVPFFLLRPAAQPGFVPFRVFTPFRSDHSCLPLT